MFEREIAEILLNIQAVKVKIDPPFTWTSGIKSPVYCDNRMLISHPKEFKFVTKCFKKLIEEKGLKPEVIGGTATAAIPWAAFLAYEMDLPMVYIRPEKKEHGAGRQVEGNIPAGKRVLIVEDLISTGGSSVNSAEAVRRECQGQVTDVLAIMTWELQKAADTFKVAGLNWSTLTNFTNLIGLAVEKGQVKPAEHQVVLQFKDNPAEWGKKMGF